MPQSSSRPHTPTYATASTSTRPQLGHDMAPYNSSHLYDTQSHPPSFSTPPPSYGDPEVRLPRSHNHAATPVDSRTSPVPPASSQRPRPAGASEHQHRVYVLNCAHCGNFLSDRGMRAVLLLKPNITLYSTDASPMNSGPLFNDYNSDYETAVERTCDCLTQSMGCWGCGNVVGYHIISPCARCCQSVAKHQRSANGHRWVFHVGEIKASERRYFPGEKGINLPREPSPVPFEGLHNPIDNKDGYLAIQTTTNNSSASARPPDASYASGSASALRSRSRNAPLHSGDTLMWHHLISSGERCEPIDPRTRVYPPTVRVGR